MADEQTPASETPADKTREHVLPEAVAKAISGEKGYAPRHSARAEALKEHKP